MDKEEDTEPTPEESALLPPIMTAAAAFRNRKSDYNLRNAFDVL